MLSELEKCASPSVGGDFLSPNLVPVVPVPLLGAWWWHGDTLPSLSKLHACLEAIILVGEAGWFFFTVNLTGFRITIETCLQYVYENDSRKIQLMRMAPSRAVGSL